MLSHDNYSQPDAEDPVLNEPAVLDLMRPHGVGGSKVTGVDETGGRRPWSGYAICYRPGRESPATPEAASG